MKGSNRWLLHVAIANCLKASHWGHRSIRRLDEGANFRVRLTWYFTRNNRRRSWNTSTSNFSMKPFRIWKTSTIGFNAFYKSAVAKDWKQLLNFFLDKFNDGQVIVKWTGQVETFVARRHCPSISKQRPWKIGEFAAILDRRRKRSLTIYTTENSLNYQVQLLWEVAIWFFCAACLYNRSVFSGVMYFKFSFMGHSL